MKVYLLVGELNYEGHWPLGIYSSLEAAKESVSDSLEWYDFKWPQDGTYRQGITDLRADSVGAYDGYMIMEMDLISEN